MSVRVAGFSTIAASISEFATPVFLMVRASSKKMTDGIVAGGESSRPGRSMMTSSW
jgi:hypothetical protein